MGKVIRLAIFSAYYPPHLGGVELFTKNMADALVWKGVDVTIVTSELSEVVSDDLDEPESNPRIVYLPSVSIMGERFPIIVPSRAFYSARNTLREKDFDGIVVNTRYYPISLFGCLEAKKRGIAPVLIDHSSGYINSDSSLIGMITRLYERVMTNQITNAHALFCSVSSKGLKWLHDLNLQASAIIPNSIDVAEYRSISSNRDWRHELQIEPSAFLVTYAGRLISEKGIPKLLDAMNELGDRHPNIVLAIAGAGPLEKEIENTCNSNIKYLGRLSQADLSSLLHESDCFCLPSEYPEGLPTVLLEAAAQECAIVVSDCAGARDVVSDSSMGLILDEVTKTSIAGALIKCSNDRELSSEMGKSVRANVENSFSWDVSADSLLALI